MPVYGPDHQPLGDQSMSNPKFLILYVDNPKLSGAFYADLLGRPPVEESPGFVLFALDTGFMLGLWSRHTAQPAATASGGGTEMAFTVKDAATVAATFTDWRRRGLPILQTPVDLDFGHTFVALDPDGHRLRVFAPAEK
jgi:catechol 2,3-dioxygenase-like lactoylglutathione lyase family enzyme